MICFAKPELTEDLYYSAQGRIFNNMLYVLYVRLTKVKRSLFIKDKPILSSESMLHEDYDRKGSVAK
jgi:adenylate cyclase class IV